MFDVHRFVFVFCGRVRLGGYAGPGIFYVLARSLAGGKREGILSSLGTFVGGLFHVVAAALGVSAILAASPSPSYSEIRRSRLPGLARHPNDSHAQCRTRSRNHSAIAGRVRQAS